MTMYRVVGECAHVTTDLQGRGMTRVLMYKGSVLPADVPEKELEHLLSIRAIALLDGGPAAPAPAAEEPGAGGEGGSAPSDDPSGDSDPGDGGEPGSEGDDTDPGDGETGEQAGDEPAEPSQKPAPSANKATWVEWAVSQGADPDEAAKSSKADLVEAYGK